MVEFVSDEKRNIKKEREKQTPKKEGIPPSP
jgi:hypothetical protein